MLQLQVHNIRISSVNALRESVVTVARDTDPAGTTKHLNYRARTIGQRCRGAFSLTAAGLIAALISCFYYVFRGVDKIYLYFTGLTRSHFIFICSLSAPGRQPSTHVDMIIIYTYPCAARRVERIVCDSQDFGRFWFLRFFSLRLQWSTCSTQILIQHE